jgi:hypothetical protein
VPFVGTTNRRDRGERTSNFIGSAQNFIESNTCRKQEFIYPASEFSKKVQWPLQTVVVHHWGELAIVR